MNEYSTGTWRVSFKGLHKTDFRKCLAMARKMDGQYDGSAWTFDGSYGINASRLEEMASRGARIESVA
jgi:hypothetical protein